MICFPFNCSPGAVGQKVHKFKTHDVAICRSNYLVVLISTFDWGNLCFIETRTGKGLFFDRGFLGDGARLLQCLHDAYLVVLGDPLKNGDPTDCFTQQFS